MLPIGDVESSTDGAPVSEDVIETTSPKLTAAERINQRLRALSVGAGRLPDLDDKVKVISSPLKSPAPVLPLETPPPRSQSSSRQFTMPTCKDVLFWLVSCDNERLATCALVRQLQFYVFA